MVARHSDVVIVSSCTVDKGHSVVRYCVVAGHTDVVTVNSTVDNFVVVNCVVVGAGHTEVTY